MESSSFFDRICCVGSASFISRPANGGGAKVTTIGFPVGLNIYYSDRFAFSYEFTPSIVASKSTGKPGTSKTSNLLFDPGPMFRFKNGFTIIARLAFETQGRYGFTPVFRPLPKRGLFWIYQFILRPPLITKPSSGA